MMCFGDGLILLNNRLVPFPNGMDLRSDGMKYSGKVIDSLRCWNSLFDDGMDG